MQNREVESMLAACAEELEGIRNLLAGLGEAANPTPYLKRYAVIRASGSIEAGFKQIIADKVDANCDVQVKNFIARKIRNSSYNPKLSAIEQILSEFDKRWRAKFDEQIGLGDKPRFSGALTKLVNARNEFAHGGAPDMDIAHTIENYNGGCDVLRILDSVVHFNYDVEEPQDDADL
jgi:hypothetical protein